jgi:hypothetical protein
MTRRIATRGVASLVGIALALGILSGATTRPADAASRATTALTVQAPPQAKLGQRFTISARLTSGGSPVTSRVLALYVNGAELRTRSVDAKGMAAFPIRPTDVLRSGAATFTVRFAGSASLTSASRSVTVEFLPVRLVIQTVPSVDNVPITVGTVTKTTLQGEAVFPINTLGDYDVTPQIAKASTGSMRADFVRWSDNVYTVDRKMTITGDVTLQLGVHVAYRGSFHFLSEAGKQIDSSQIESVVLTSTGGSQVRLTSYDNVWLEAGTAVRHANGLVESSRDWRILEVNMAGANVVNRGQQRFRPTPNGAWNVTVLLYDLTVQAQDAIFGNPLTGNLTLTYPNGTSTSVTLSAGSSVSFPQLPRGDYVLKLGTNGLGAPTPVALSRGQTAVIRVITYADIALVAGIGLAFALGMLLLGRYRAIRKSSGPILTELRRREQVAAARLVPVTDAVIGSTRGTIDQAATRLNDLTERIAAERPRLTRIGQDALSATAAAVRTGSEIVSEHSKRLGEWHPATGAFGTGFRDRQYSARPAAAPRICHQCGSRMKPDAAFCAWCGTRLHHDA